MKSLLEHARLLTMVALIGSALTAMGDSNPPNLMTYQGRVYNNSGNPVEQGTTGSHTISFRIYDLDTGGNLLWAESQNVTVSDGYFSVLLGQGSGIGTDPHNSLSDLFKGDASARYIGITLDTGSEIAPRLRFLPSPYAFLAQRATSLVDSTGAEAISVGTGSQITVGQLNATTVNGSGGIANKIYGELHGDGKEITNLNASELKDGTVALGRMHPNVVRTDTTQTIAGNKTFSGEVAIDGGLFKVKASTITIGTAAQNTVTINPNGNITTDGDITADKITASGKVVAENANNSFAGHGTIPIRGIIMWYGTQDQLPDGWNLCDGGTYDGVVTPDLRNRFVMGGRFDVAANYYQASSSGANKTGGSTNVTIGVGNIPTHKHKTKDGIFVTQLDDGDKDTLSGATLGYESTPAGANIVGATTDDRNNNQVVYRIQESYPDIYNPNSGNLVTAQGETPSPLQVQPPYYVLAFIIRTK